MQDCTGKTSVKCCRVESITRQRLLEHSDLRFESIHRFILLKIRPFDSAAAFAWSMIICHDIVRCLCEVVRVTHDDGVELTSNNIANDSSLYASEMLNRIESKNRFVLENRIESEYFFLNQKNRFDKENWIGIFFSESECSSGCAHPDRHMQTVKARDVFCTTWSCLGLQSSMAQSQLGLGLISVLRQNVSRDNTEVMCCSAFFQRQQLQLVLRSLSTGDAKTLVQAFISTRLDHCNLLLYGTTCSDLQLVPTPTGHSKCCGMSGYRCAMV